MADMGVTETVATAKLIISDMVQQELIETSNILGTVMNYTSEVEPGAKSVAIPRAGSFTAAAKTENTEATKQVLTFATDVIALDQHKQVTVRLEDIARRQAGVNVEAQVIERMASAMVYDIEAYLYAKVKKAANDIQLTGTSNLLITKADILNARKTLDDAKVPNADRYILISPNQEAAMLNISDFVKANEYGSVRGIQNGELGEIFGLKVIKSTVVGDTEAFVYHKSHVGFALDLDMDFEKSRAPAGFYADDFALQAIYGAVQLDSGNRGVMLDESAVA